MYYERQENAFDQLSAEDLEDYGIREESKAIQMLKLTQTFLLTDGSISKLSEMRRVFEDDKTYDHVFRKSRLRADSRHILLCYKVQFRLRKLAREIEQKGQNKYWFISRARYLLWALLCQGLLNDDDLEGASQRGTALQWFCRRNTQSNWYGWPRPVCDHCSQNCWRIGSMHRRSRRRI